MTFGKALSTKLQRNDYNFSYASRTYLDEILLPKDRKLHDLHSSNSSLSYLFLSHNETALELVWVRDAALRHLKRYTPHHESLPQNDKNLILHESDTHSTEKDRKHSQPPAPHDERSSMSLSYLFLLFFGETETFISS